MAVSESNNKAEESAPTVSIVMPVRNQERVLRETFESVEAQVFGDFELIVVDDGSDDDSIEIEREFAARDSRMRLFLRDYEGAARARNFGLDQAAGKYVLFLDSDDLFHPLLLVDMAGALDESDADMCMCEWETFSSNVENVVFQFDFGGFGEGLHERRGFGRKTFQLGSLCVWNKLFRRERLLKCGARFQDTRVCNDGLFVTEMVWDAETIYLVRESLIHHRRGLGTSIQDRRLSHAADPLLVAEEVFDRLYEECLLTPDERLSLLDLCTELLISALRNSVMAGSLDDELYNRMMDDLDKWGVLDIPSWKLGRLPFMMQSSLMKNATKNDVVKVYEHLGFYVARSRPLGEKVGLGFRILAAIARGKLGSGSCDGSVPFVGVDSIVAGVKKGIVALFPADCRRGEVLRAAWSSAVVARYRVEGFLIPDGHVECYCPCCEMPLRAWAVARWSEQPDKFDVRRFAGVPQDVVCPVCASVPRGRIIVWHLGQHPELAWGKKILHFAPERGVLSWLRHWGFDVTTADLFGDADLKLDLCDIDLPDGSYDIAICNHVLAHVADWRRALAELRRVLSPGGLLICSFPIDQQYETVYENADVVTAADRVAHFGAHDHLRVFGAASATLLVEAGFEVEVISGADCPDAIRPVVGPADYDSDQIFFCRKQV